MIGLGAAVRDRFLLDPDFLTVNHGSFGALPRTVAAAQDDWRRRMEAQPSRFMELVLPQALRDAARALARFLNAEARDIGFVDNATTGCNAVLRSLRFEAGDEILVLDQGYGAVRNTVRHVAERSGARLVEAPMPFPRPDARAIVAAIAGRISTRTRLAVIDHITSSSAVLLPLAEVIGACRASGVPVLVDGAHAPGSIDLDVQALDADWYVGNCHKWLCAPKGSAFLWARRDRQEGLHPTTISHGYDRGFLTEFDWTGTRDPSPYLSVGAAIAFHEELGGAALRARNRALAAEGARIVAERLGTEAGAAPERAASMAVVRLPIAGRAAQENIAAMRRRLLQEFRTDAPLSVQRGAYWMRLSAAAYNEPADYARLAEIALKLARGAN